MIQHHPLFQITPVLDTGLSLSEPRQLYQGPSLDSSAVYMDTLSSLITADGAYHCRMGSIRPFFFTSIDYTNDKSVSGVGKLKG